MGPTLKKIKQKPNKQKKEKGNNANGVRENEISEEKKILFLLFKFSQIYENLTFGFRRDKHKKCSTRRGLRVRTKNMGFHREFR